jgi:hypothetical protein
MDSTNRQYLIKNKRPIGFPGTLNSGIIYDVTGGLIYIFGGTDINGNARVLPK